MFPTLKPFMSYNVVCWREIAKRVCPGGIVGPLDTKNTYLKLSFELGVKHRWLVVMLWSE